ncbi:MCE family protein, partial [Streptomyces sp. SID6648]|nr:MCE family protein [Streptomyces sp. SID6648]
MTRSEHAHTRRRPLTGPLVKSLVFVVVTALATTVLGLSVAGTGVGSGTGTSTYKALFTDVTGLMDGDSVRISGVTVGEVTDV